MKSFIASSAAALIYGGFLFIGTTSALAGNQGDIAVRINPPGYYPPPAVYSPPPPLIVPSQPVYGSPPPVYAYPGPLNQAPFYPYGNSPYTSGEPNWHRHGRQDWREGEDWRLRRDGSQDSRR